jgi:dolichyl-phosphate beta-glucosyltransferase
MQPLEPCAAIAVPCFNEAGRLGVEQLLALSRSLGHLVLVDDGSTDDTHVQLEALAASAAPGTVEVIRLPSNAGKAEAVRVGMQRALESGAPVVGYFDADLATPTAELERMVELLDADPSRQVVLASRVGLLGYRIERRMTRHYLGRVYATAASLTLGIPVYDTQCGAKVFRSGPELAAALEQSFPDRWSFDVELLARLLYPAPLQRAVDVSQIVEMPLREWRDVGGSKLGLVSGVRATLALAGVRRRIRRRAGAGATGR